MLELAIPPFTGAMLGAMSRGWLEKSQKRGALEFGIWTGILIGLAAGFKGAFGMQYGSDPEIAAVLIFYFLLGYVASDLIETVLVIVGRKP